MLAENKKIKKARYLMALLFVLALFLVSGSVWADDTPTLTTDINTEMNSARTSSGLSSQDPREIVAKIINGALSLLGVIFLALIVYAGFQWMTAGGEESKVEEAQKLLKNAIIGLVIILLAYAITAFVVNNLISASSGGAGAGGAPAGGGSLPPSGVPDVSTFSDYTDGHLGD